MNNEKGFTLIELLITIAIVAALAVAVILYINPAELLKQSRDSVRISDADTIRKSLELYIHDSGGTLPGDPALCYASVSVALPGGCNIFKGGQTATSSATPRSIDGTGWIALAFDKITSGSPLEILPLDPLNTADYYYAFATNGNGSWELGVNQMESTRYRRGGENDIVSRSSYSGSNPQAYVIGSSANLDL
jgi:prepilin-type N-terminal cleavage/methylation domain-containing protein